MSWERVENLLREGVETGVYPGAAAGVVRADGSVWIRAVGKTAGGKNGAPVTERSLFDLASLTKVLATTAICARLKARGEINLDELLVPGLPGLPWHSDWKNVTLRDVLAHQAGFAAWADLAKEVRAEKPGSPAAREKMLGAAAAMPAAYPRGTSVVYSDLGFILLGAWLERFSKQPLEKITAAEVNRPLGLRTLFPNPLARGVSLSEIAATEEIPWRGGVVHGEVHDDNAYMLGGMAGHAGLFGTVESCLAAGASWLRACAGKSDDLPSSVAREFMTRVLAPSGPARALGWDLPSETGSSAGSAVSRGAVGHLGYTGTSLWIDPQRNAAVALLTHRVHPTSKNEKIKRFRPAFHDAVWEALDA